MDYLPARIPNADNVRFHWFLIILPIQGAGWALAALDLDRRITIALEIFPDAPEVGSIWQKLAEMIHGADLREEKPELVQIEPEWLLVALSSRLNALGVAAQPGSVQGRRLATELLGEASAPAELPGLMEADDISSQDISPLKISPHAAQAFFQAARRFYRAAPWKGIEDGEALAVRVEPPGWTRYIILMGESGTETGLAIYSDLENVRLASDAASQTDHLPEDGLLALTFETRAALPQADLRAIRRYRWPVAGPNAYPLPLSLTPQGVRRPNMESLAFLEAILNGLPEFIRSELPAIMAGETAEALAEYAVDTSAGTVRVTFVYPAEFADWQGAPGLESGVSMDENEMRAFALAHKAWQEPDTEQRALQAREALALSENAVEAYLVLAEEAEYPQEALDWLEKGVLAGARLLEQTKPPTGPAKTYEAMRMEGNLWAARSARPYLRALQAQAETLELLGRGQEALQGYEELLRLNRADHTGARFPALGLMLRMNRDGEAAALIERYPEDDSPDWEFSRALLQFRAAGDSTHARQALLRACACNKHAPAYLTGNKPLPADPDEAQSQEEAEAAAYVLRSYPTWWSTPGAIEWLRSLENDQDKG